MQWMEVAASSSIIRETGTVGRWSMDNGRFQGDSGSALAGLQVSDRLTERQPGSWRIGVWFGTGVVGTNATSLGMAPRLRDGA